MAGHEGGRGSEATLDDPFESEREPLQVHPGSVLMAEGEQADWFAYMISGSAIVSRRSVAWVVLDPDADPASAEPVGTARYFRSRGNPNEAEIALGMVDRVQGRGIGKRLLDTLAVTASVAGIETFTASVLRDNAAMRALLRRPGTRWTNDEPGVVRAFSRTDEFGTSLGPHERAAIEDVSASIVWSSVAVLL